MEVVRKEKERDRGFRQRKLRFGLLAEGGLECSSSNGGGGRVVLPLGPPSFRNESRWLAELGLTRPTSARERAREGRAWCRERGESGKD